VHPVLDVGGDLDGPPVEVEEPEAVAAAGGLHLAGLVDQLDLGGAQPFGEGVDVGRVGRAVGDQVEAFVLRLAQADDVLLG
jgi:hypothetical protein